MTLSVADRLALSDLVHRYAAYVDTRQYDDVAELFTDTALLTVPKPPGQLGPSVEHSGHAGVRAAMAALGGIARTHHGIVGEVYTDAGGEGGALGFITCIAHHWTRGEGGFTDTVWYLRYADAYRRTDAGWRIARRALSIDAIETQQTRHVRI